MTAIVCMATYNGGRWLQGQIDSVREQSDRDWVLLVSDDGSHDETLAVIHDNVRRDPRIQLLERRDARAGVVGNFEYLLAKARTLSGDFVALCDQDDLWSRDKIARQREQLTTALACCSDPELVDAQGRLRGCRLSQQLTFAKNVTVSSLLAQNSVVGCTLAFRPEVLELAMPFPEGLENHDWWLALCALCSGSVVFEEEVQVHYRQHDGNVVGAYRPLRQLLQLPRLLARQESVLASQLSSLHILSGRLESRGMATPPELAEYSERLEMGSLTERVGALSKGDYAAPHLPLRALRVIAALKSFPQASSM